MQFLQLPVRQRNLAEAEAKAGIRQDKHETSKGDDVWHRKEGMTQANRQSFPDDNGPNEQGLLDLEVQETRGRSNKPGPAPPSNRGMVRRRDDDGSAGEEATGWTDMTRRSGDHRFFSFVPFLFTFSAQVRRRVRITDGTPQKQTNARRQKTPFWRIFRPRPLLFFLTFLHRRNDAIPLGPLLGATVLEKMISPVVACGQVHSLNSRLDQDTDALSRKSPRPHMRISHWTSHLGGRGADLTDG